MTYEIPDDKIMVIGEMLQYTNNKSTKEIMDSAMTLLEWAIEQSKCGKDIVAINGSSGSSGTYNPLKMPILEKAKP